MTKVPEQYDAHIRARADALRAVLPAEPPEGVIQRMQFAFGIALDQPWRAANAYRALRAHLLGEA